MIVICTCVDKEFKQGGNWLIMDHYVVTLKLDTISINQLKNAFSMWYMFL